MLAITQPKTPSKTPPQIIPNILPCKIVHSGPIPTPKRHWNPQPSSSPSPSSSDPSEACTTQTAYFRGRKLLGKTIPLPEGYEGKVLLKTGALLPQAPHVPGNDEEEEEEEVPEEVKQAEQVSSFKEVVVWGHESLPGEGDEYVQGLEEWVGFAERLHAYDIPNEEAPTATT